MGPESRANVRVTNLSKTFVVPEREAGLRAAVGSLFHRKTRGVRAVDAISFEIGPGEVVGFLGPNGAGKTTTLKMLSGLLYPTSGQASVLGFLPVALVVIKLVYSHTTELNGGGPADRTTTLVLSMFDNAFQFYRMGYASAIAWFLFLLIMLVTATQFLSQRRCVHYDL